MAVVADWNFGELQAEAIRIKGYSTDDFSADKVKDTLNLALSLMGKAARLKEKWLASTTAGVSEYDIPSDCYLITALKIDNKEYKHVSLRDVLDDNNLPSRYFYEEQTDVIKVYPEPTDTGANNIEMWGYRHPTIMTGDSDVPEVPWGFREALADYVKYRILEHMEADTRAQFFRVRFEQAVAKLDADTSRGLKRARTVRAGAYR